MRMVVGSLYVSADAVEATGLPRRPVLAYQQHSVAANAVEREPKDVEICFVEVAHFFFPFR